LIYFVPTLPGAAHGNAPIKTARVRGQASGISHLMLKTNKKVLIGFLKPLFSPSEKVPHKT
jgi:hypothetical protein